jgi:hypothetical protein
MKLSEQARAQFRQHGRRGGQARARSLTSDARQAIARRAAIRRWTRERFGATSFASLRLPGGAMIDQGLDDLAANRETAESLAISLASSRLRREGVPLPAACFPDAEWRLYRLEEAVNEELGHARYLARLRQVSSFADACRNARIDGGPDA